MTDTERLDAIGRHGLCVIRHDTMGPGGWEESWACHYQDWAVVGETIREVIDTAVLAIVTDGQLPN